MDIAELQQVARKIKSLDLRQIALQEIKRKADFAEDLITSDQLFNKGIGGDGQRIESQTGAPYPYYSGYQELKRSLGLPSNRVTLFLEGDFHRSIFIQAEKYPVLFDFLDPKEPELTFKYDDKYKELTVENMEKFFSECRPGTIQSARKQIGPYF